MPPSYLSLLLVVVFYCHTTHAQFRLDKWRAGRQGIRQSRTSCRLGEKCQYFSSCLRSQGRITGTCTVGFQTGVCCRTIDSFYITISRLRQMLGYRRVQPNAIITHTYSAPRIISSQTRFTSRRDCGRRKISRGRQSRIVNGNNATFGEFPWQLLISGSEDTCGGAILSEDWAITAAHCVHSEDIHDILVTAGDYVLDSASEPLIEQNRSVDEVIIHSGFNSTSYEYDLALLRLSEPLDRQPHIQPICLPEGGSDYIGRYGVATGWGELYPAGQEANVLQKVSLPILNSRTCMDMFSRSGLDEDIPSFFVCAGYSRGQKDACQGDSGGPLQVREPDGSFTLVGVMSWGIGCAEPNQPGVYTKVSDFVNWIRQITDIYN